MINKLAIEKAIEGGWKHFDLGEGKEATERAAHNILAISHWQVIALDPSFWQSLGKALGWAEYTSWLEQYHEGSIDLTDLTWRRNATRFYDLILTGQPTDQFWKEILATRV